MLLRVVATKKSNPSCHSREGGNPHPFMEKTYYVYILASHCNGTLYIGITNDLKRRIHEHKNCLVKGFTEKYNIHNLVYYEETNNVESAIEREKQIKKWNREWKINLIKSKNPTWRDLYNSI